MSSDHPTIIVENQRTKVRRPTSFECFAIEGPIAVLHFGSLVGRRDFSLNHGYGMALATSKEAPIREWRIIPEHLELLREMARSKGKKVTPCGKSTGRPKQPKRGPNSHPKQMSFGDPK